MAIKDMFQVYKKEGYITLPLDKYLFLKSTEDNDRAINVNAPSQAGKCLRSSYYARMSNYSADGGINPRTQRVFDNGSFVHERLQGYLKEAGLLHLDEVPLLHERYNIQGHTDGYLNLPNDEVAILEIKSIHDKGFIDLKDARIDHKQQGLIYLFCAEERRLFLHKTYKTLKDFNQSYPDRYSYFETFYQHLKGGRKYSREEKIKNEVLLNLISDNILFDTKTPITKVIFLYENKNNQELKEFVVTREGENEKILQDLLKGYEYLNDCCEKGLVPERGGTSKNCNTCRWCDFKNTCWVV